MKEQTKTKILEVTTTILESLLDAGRLLPMPFETKYQHIRRIRNLDRPKFERAARQLANKGWVTVSGRGSNKLIQLTKSGQLETLVRKIGLAQSGRWDGKWRLVMFDIPESQYRKRRLLRFLLKKIGFYKLQASVYVHPRAFNREALRYLQDSGLITFIRIMRVDEMDNDKLLRVHFGI